MGLLLHPGDDSDLCERAPRDDQRPEAGDAPAPLHAALHAHTFASLLLSAGESVVYVQRQLGHASIQLTVDTYGKWLPIGNKSAVDRLDDPATRVDLLQSGSKVVEKRGNGGRAKKVQVLEL